MGSMGSDMGFGWLLLAASTREWCGRVRFSSWYANRGERRGVSLASSGGFFWLLEVNAVLARLVVLFFAQCPFRHWVHVMLHLFGAWTISS